MRRIDSHQHFWRYDAAAFPWINADMGVLARDWLPDNLLPLMQTRGVERCIAVQARTVPEETDFLLDLAQRHAWIAGVIGWVELRTGDVAERLARWQDHPAAAALKGFRHLLQDEPDVPAVLADATFGRNVATLQARGLVYELLVHAHQFDGLAQFCATHDRHTLVLDHLGKPPIRDSGKAAFNAWRSALRPLAAQPHVLCKLSGLVTEARWRDGRLDGQGHADFHRWLDTALELFGPQRLMFGSDWPVCLLAAPHGEVVTLLDDWSRTRLSPDDCAALWADNASRCYGLA